MAEDGYLTLRIRTLWSSPHATHVLNLVTGTNPEDPYELELRHDAKGDDNGSWGDALIAFNLNKLPGADRQAKPESNLSGSPLQAKNLLSLR